MASILLNIWPKILTLFVKTDLNSELYNSRIWNQKKKKEILICALIPIHSSVYCMRSWSFNPTNSEWIIFTDNAYDTCRFLLLFCMLILIYDLTDIQTNVKYAKIWPQSEEMSTSISRFFRLRTVLPQLGASLQFNYRQLCYWYSTSVLGLHNDVVGWHILLWHSELAAVT